MPYVKDTDTIILANHGTITYGSDLEDAYFKTEIIDAYCRILILAKQLGRVQLLHRREGRRADQAQAEPRHPRPPARARASRTATSAATACSAKATATSSPSPSVFIHPKLAAASRHESPIEARRRRSPPTTATGSDSDASRAVDDHRPGHAVERPANGTSR